VKLQIWDHSGNDKYESQAITYLQDS